ncbi:MAG: vWA domain-containing protein [Bacteroidota bacterium]|jgi:Ca-activated chloride channel family protein
MFRIANPELLILYALVAVVVGLFAFATYRNKRQIRLFAEWNTYGRLASATSTKKPYLKLVLRSLAVLMLVTAVIRPQIGSGLEEVKRKGVDVVVALDVSNSMNARDIQPSRLERSVQSIYRIIDKLQGDRIGLVVFAGQAFVQLPITTDYGAAKLFLSNINTGMVPSQGTAIGAAIEKCMETVGDSSIKSTAIIVITDGENHEDDAIETAKEAASKGFVVHTVGMGSPQGSPVPDGRGNFISDGSGGTVVSRLDDALLQQVADAGKGKYVRASSNADALSVILSEIDAMEKKEFSSKMFTIYDEQFMWFLAAALFFLVLEMIITDRKTGLLSSIKLFGEQQK